MTPDPAAMPDSAHVNDPAQAPDGHRAISAPRLLAVDPLIDDPETRIVVCCGAGGVGKTTTAAALGLRAAERGRKVVVLTIDPARRLAQSMGIDSLDNTPRRVKGIDGNGELHAMMLDMKRTFDEIVEAHADPDRASGILSNPFYQSLSAGFAGTQEYMAMEKLGQLRARDEWDLIVVDTPPSRSALDFLDAPKRLGSFLDGKLIRVLLAPAKVGGRAGMKFLNVGMSMMTGALGKLLGGQLLKDVQTFVAAMDSMFGGFRTRADATYKLLQAPGTAFLVVAAPERTRCGRRRTSWSGWRPRTCRWPAWCSTGCTAAARPSCRPSARSPPRKILTSPALLIRWTGKQFVTLPTRTTVQTVQKLPQPPVSRPTPLPRTGRWNTSRRACSGCTPSGCGCSPASSARVTASPRFIPRWPWPKWPRCPVTSTTWRVCGTSGTGSRP